MLRFDHPLSERVRNLIRIEHLFNRFNHTAAGEDKWSHHVALGTLFEIMECSSRAELKLDILQELERQRQESKHQDNVKLLEQISQTTHDLQDVQQKFGQHIRENEWLMALKQRIIVAGGTTPVELPSYYFWQKMPAEQRRNDLYKWSMGMMPTFRAASLLLRILRNNQQELACVAESGNFQHNSLAQNIHLLMLDIPIETAVMPEVSANKYFTHIRFLEANQENMRGKVSEKNIPFTLKMCSFDAQWK